MEFLWRAVSVVAVENRFFVKEINLLSGPSSLFLKIWTFCGRKGKGKGSKGRK